MLAELGYRVSGSDFSASMLKVASKNLERHGIQIPLSRCDFRELQEAFTEKFDAVVCLTTALPHLHTDEDLLTALISMKDRLNKNGLLILTQGTTHFTLTLPSIEVVVNRDNFSRIFVKEHDDQFQTIHVIDNRVVIDFFLDKSLFYMVFFLSKIISYGLIGNAHSPND